MLVQELRQNDFIRRLRFAEALLELLSDDTFLFMSDETTRDSFIGNGLECLRITELIIPRHANLGASVTLVCKFDLGRGRLYSVKWYKDEQEFFRYMPEYHPQSQIFPQVGVQLDETMSDMNRVTLNQVGYGSSGLYKCEVSTEAPAFETAIYNGSMEVLAFPDGDPVITGVAPTYSIGDYITGNCTSARSKPPPILSWFINGVKADSWLLDKYEVLEHPGPVFSRSLGLRFQAEKRHFQGHGQTVMLKCQVQVSDLSPQIKTVTPQLASGASANQKLAQQRLRNAAGESINQSSEMMAIILCSLAIVYLS